MKHFGTDGARGAANVTITPKLAMDLGKAYTYILKKDTVCCNIQATIYTLILYHLPNQTQEHLKHLEWVIVSLFEVKTSNLC